VLCYDNQQKPGAISKHGKTISTWTSFHTPRTICSILNIDKMGSVWVLVNDEYSKDEDVVKNIIY
jgi:hypothetical protein